MSCNGDTENCVDTNLHFTLKPFDYDLKLNKDEIPDPQNFHENGHAKITIPKVGISKLELPIQIKTRDGKSITTKGVASAYVSLDDPEARGINMSRLARGFYDRFDKETNALELLDLVKVVEDYKTKLPAENGHIKLRFEFPYKQKHPAEDTEGWMYYPVEFQVDNVNGVVSTYITVTYTYVSSCPCSYALAQYSINELDTPAIPHSQRSEAVVKMKFDHTGENLLWIEDIIDKVRIIQPSEVLAGVVSRVDELGMSRMAASEGSDGDGAIGFIEDVLRRFWTGLNSDERILDFSVGMTHFESLNDNYASGFINKSLDYDTGLN